MVNLRTPNAKDVDNNALIAKTVEKNQNVHLVDWLGASAGHDDWFGEDGIHLTWDGRDAYADLLVKTMQYEPPNSENSMYNVVLMGDTVCLDAADQLAKAYPRGLVDTADGRKSSAVTEALKGYVDEGHMGNTVILAIGSEEPLSKEDLDAMIATVGDTRKVWLVNTQNPNTWCETNNALMAQTAQERSNVQLVDWHAASMGQDGWFDVDGMHLTPEGVNAFVNELSTNVEVEIMTQGTDADEQDADAAEEGTGTDDLATGTTEQDTGTADQATSGTDQGTGATDQATSGTDQGAGATEQATSGTDQGAGTTGTTEQTTGSAGQATGGQGQQGESSSTMAEAA
jgi:hypothetical protein